MKYIKKFFKFVLYSFGVLFALTLGVAIFVGPTEEQVAKKEAQRAEDKARQARIEENERIAKANKEKSQKMKGFHCLSAWDGSLRDERALKNSLNDPGSYEHVETRITPVNSDGVHTAYVTFRARNGFGGLVLSKATVIVDNETCNNAVLEIQ